MDRSDNREQKKEFTSLASATAPALGEFRNTFEQELLKKDGWVMRGFLGQHGFGDHRTAGFRENLDHPDFQIYYPISPAAALDSFKILARLVKEGSKFKDGDTSTDIAEGLTVKFISVHIDTVEFLRLVIPDKQGRFDQGAISAPYSLQYRDRIMTADAKKN